MAPNVPFQRYLIQIFLIFAVLLIGEKALAEDAAFNVCIMIRRGSTCNFTVNSHNVSGVTGYTIDFGDTSSPVTFTDIATISPHVYTSVGVYDAVLTFNGPGTKVTKKVTVREAIVNATIKMSSFLCVVGKKLTFSNMVTPNISTDAYYKLGNSEWLAGRSMQCNTTGLHSLLIFIENGVSAVLFKCLVNITAVEADLTVSPPYGVVNQTVLLTPSITPPGEYSFLYVFPTNVVVNCSNSSSPYIFTSSNYTPGHLVEVIISDSKDNSAKFSKNVIVVDPLVPPFDIKCPGFVGIGMTASFTMTLSNDRNVSYNCNFGDNSESVNVTEKACNHVYKQQGRYTVNITAKGLANEISSTCEVRVVEGIQGLSCAQTIIATPLGDPTALGWVVENGTDFSIKFQINPTLPTYLVVNLTAQDLLVVYKQHNYTAIGEYVVPLYAWNFVSNVSSECRVVVQEPIGFINVEFVYPDDCIEMNTDVTVKVSLNGTRPTIEFDFGTGDNDKYNSTKTQVTQRWTTHGNMNVTITARNNVSSRVFNKEIFIPKPVVILTSLSMYAPYSNLTNNTRLVMRIGQGSDFRCNVTWGHVSNVTQYCYNYTYFLDNNLSVTPYQNLVLTEHHMYKVEGWYVITAVCFNRRSNVTASTITNVLKPITGFAPVPLPPQILGTNFAAKFTMDGGSNVTVRYYFNDVLAQGSVLVDNANGSLPIVFNQEYSAIGHYTVWFHAKNLVSEWNSTAYTVTIQDAITELSCNVTSHNPFSDAGLPTRCSNKSDTFAVEFPITLPANPNKGTNLSCYYTFDDGRTVNTTNLTVDHKYAIKRYKRYNPTVTCYNLVSSVSCCFPINMEQTVKTLTVTNNGPKKFNHDLTFTVNVEDFGTGTCFTFDYMDGTPIDIHGPEHCTKLKFTQGQQYFTQADSISTFTAQHAYANVNEYFVKINATNNVSCLAVENQAVSVLKECRYPNVSIKDVGDNMTIVPYYYRSETKQYALDVEVFCEVSRETNYTWKAYKVQDFSNKTIDPPEEIVIPNAKLTNPILTVFSRGLDYGMYMFEVTVYMVKTIGVRTIKKGYVGITCTPYIIATIKDGNKLKRQVGNVLPLDGTPSRDPDHDVGDHINMTFHWFCRLVNEAALEVNNYEAIPAITLPNKNADPATLTSGGCFGTGRGRLPFNTSTIALDSSLPGVKTGLDKSMVITLVVVKNDSCGIRIGQFEQYIEFTKDAIPIVSTVCKLNCIPRININEKVSYETNCTFCQPGATFDWTIGKLKSCDGNPTDPNNMDMIPTSIVNSWMYGETTSFHMVLKEGVLDAGSCYTCTIKATNPDKKFGENSFTFQTNSAPTGGTLVVTPNIGLTINTTFTAIFDGWVDVDNDYPLVYSCGIWDGSNFQLIAESSEVNLEIILPSGDEKKDYNITLRCQCSDRQGASTQHVKTVQVLPLNETALQLYGYLDNMINDQDGALRQAVQKGDVQGILLLSNAISKMLDEEFEKDQNTMKQNLTDAEKEGVKNNALQRSKLRNDVLEELKNIDIDTVGNAAAMAVACNSLTSSYEDLNDESQELAMILIDKITDTLTNANPAEQSLTSMVGASSMLFSSMAQIASASALTAAYNSTEKSFNITGISKNPNATGMVSNTARAKERLEDIFNKFERVHKMLLDYKLPGESALLVYTPLLNTSISKIFFKDLATTNGGDGQMSVKYPTDFDIGLRTTDATKDFLNSVLSSSKNVLKTWPENANLIKSQQVDVQLSSADGSNLDTSNFKSPATIEIPLDASGVQEKDNRFMRLYKETDEMIQHLQVHSFNFTSPDMATHFEITPRNDTFKLEVYLQYGERAYPDEGKYLHNWTLPDFSSCRLDDINETTVVDEYKIYMVDPDRHCVVDPYTVFIPYDLINKTGMIYLAVVYTQHLSQETVPTTPSRVKRAIPGVACDGAQHRRMKRSCVFIPPPPPTPPTEPPEGALRERGTKSPLEDFLGRMMDANDTIKYDVRVYQTNCLFYDDAAGNYSNNGCKVSIETRKNKVVCKCTHFTSFGSDFLVAPNPIDFDKVFSADLSENFVVITVVCGLFGLYLILVIFARRADKRDEKKIGVTPLPANAAPGSRSYLISIHTGVRMNAGTTANVYVVLSGEEGEAPPVLLKDPERPLFTRGADNSLVMTIPKDVGKITHLRVWHDNTGLYPSWYLSRIVLEDLHNHNKVYFVCERWLAVEEDDGRVDRIIPVASDKELTQFNHLFVSKTVQELGDGHLWFSIIARPPQSVFTRVQRLSVALSLLYCTMITSCMFYNTGNKQEDPTYILYLGSLKIDLKQMIIGLQSSLIVFPVNLAFMQIFRKIRPDDPNEKAEKAEDIMEGFDDVWQDDGSIASKKEEEKKKKKEKKKGLHPRWRYVAWAICALSTVASAAFTVMYSLSWGPVLANKWLTAFVLSFFQSVLLIQPVKVVFAAIVFALIIRKPIENEEETNQDEITEEITKNNNEKGEKAMMSDHYMFSDGTRVGPPDELMLMAARKKRLKEIKMHTVLREIFAFLLFMAVLLLVAYGNRDPNAYLLRRSLYNSFANPSVGQKVSFESVGDVDGFWHWTRESLIPTLYPGPWYNGKETEKGLLDDHHNYLVGISRLRQERVRPDTCTILPVFRHIFPVCYGAFSLSNEEVGDFDTAWKNINKSKSASKRKRRSVEEQFSFVKETDKLVDYEKASKVLKRKRRAIDPVYVSTSGRQARKRHRGSSKSYTVLESAILADGSIMSCPTRWQYHSLLELRGFPYWGLINFYSGGGYPADLGYDYSTAMTVIADTNSHNWLDAQSRAVFNEFTIYNANTNLFAAAFLFMEFLPNGGAFPSANFVVSRLYGFVGPFAKLILAMEVLMLLFMFYFMYREFKLMYKLGKGYFHGFWNWIEVALIVLEFTMVILFFARMWETDKNFIKFHHNPKDFVSFQYATAADMTLTYVIGLLVFLVTLRFLKLLRFNKKMAFIGATINFIAKPIGLFMISFSVVFASYNCFGVVVFGSSSEFYKDNLSAAVTQMRILLGDFDYFELKSIDPILGPLYFFTYMYLIVFFLMNMFLAIINDSFAEVKDLEDKMSNEYEMVDFIMERLKSQMTFMKKGNESQVKTPYGLGSAVPFWEYKRRKSSISSDSEFSCTTNATAIKAKKNLKLMEDDISDVLKRLSEMEMEDVESDEVFMKVAQTCNGSGVDDSDSDSDIDIDIQTQYSQTTKSDDDVSSITTDVHLTE